MLKTQYLEKIATSPGIINYGRISREKFLTEIVSVTDVYVMPTYAETFGFAILEMMARKIPVISSNVFAIPELIDTEDSGLLVDMSAYDTERMFRGYTVSNIPANFKSDVDDQLIYFMERLIESPGLRESLAFGASKMINNKFSPETRNNILSNIYRDCLS
jgi:glycosyltransferase involved in cell wall biosynthesis